MKLLLLTPQLPYPPQQGTTIRNFNIIRELAPRHDVSLLAFGTDEEIEAAGPLRKLVRRVEIVPPPARTLWRRAVTTLTSPLPDMALRLRSPFMHAKTEEMLRADSFDILQVEGIEMARYAMALGASPPLVFDDHNAEYVLQRTVFRADARHPGRWHGALYSFIQAEKLTRYERTVCRRARRIIAASDADARALSALDAQLPVTIIPNGVDTAHFTPSAEPGSRAPGMVFTGKMDFRPNVDAMVWFCDDILPRIRAALPDAHLAIVGQKPAPAVSDRARAGEVQVTGWVPDSRPFISEAAVYVVPLRMGSGTRLKVLEAMAMGKAIVSTARGIEGLACTPGREALVEDTAEGFAAAVVSLMGDPSRRRELGQAARRLVVDKYDWRCIVPAFEQVYTSILH